MLLFTDTMTIPAVILIMTMVIRILVTVILIMIMLIWLLVMVIVTGMLIMWSGNCTVRSVSTGLK